jgi:hypothetical protein
MKPFIGLPVVYQLFRLIHWINVARFMHSDVWLGSISWQSLGCEFISDSLELHWIFGQVPIAELIVSDAL